MASKSSLRDYYYLTKPGIIYGNLFTAAAGFLFACRWHVNFGLFIATLAGIALVIGSACVFNNYIDRNLDRKMDRTKGRALAAGRISVPNALIYAAMLGAGGFLVLALNTNTVTVILGAVGFVDYVALYGLSKRHLTQGTLIGSISGAVPPAAGYTAVTGHFDSSAIILFLILVFWQMPHFYSIAIYRFDDYKNAGLPVLPVVKNIALVKRRIMAYIVIFTAISLLLAIIGHAGFIYMVMALALGVTWFYRGLKNYQAGDKDWGKQMFLFSLIVICGLSVTISLASVLP